jgi:hypothetical protein
MAAGVSMLANSVAQFPHFLDQLLLRKGFEIVIHVPAPNCVDRQADPFALTDQVQIEGGEQRSQTLESWRDIYCSW